MLLLFFSYTNSAKLRVENIVKGSALQTGCTSSMKLYQNLVENMVLTPSLDAIYEKYITKLAIL